MKQEKVLTGEQRKKLCETLKTRFEEHMARHKELHWDEVQEKLEMSPEKLWSLSEMEETGGEPDVVGYDSGADEYVFFDCAPETPLGRRNLCYDREALLSRKKNRPEGSAADMAEAMGISILSEEEYQALQELGEFDLKTSSWVLTPKEVRILGGALFCDRRYDRVFVFHNGAESYYSSRGFRGSLRV